MGLKQRKWAKEARHRMILRLGMKCAACGSIEKIEIDCVKPTGDEHHRMCPDQRQSYYHRQEKIRNLQLLCSRCHGHKTCLDEAGLCSCVACIIASRRRMPPPHVITHPDKVLNDITTRFNSSAEEPF